MGVVSAKGAHIKDKSICRNLFIEEKTVSRSGRFRIEDVNLTNKASLIPCWLIAKSVIDASNNKEPEYLRTFNGIRFDLVPSHIKRPVSSVNIAGEHGAWHDSGNFLHTNFLLSINGFFVHIPVRAEFRSNHFGIDSCFVCGGAPRIPDNKPHNKIYIVALKGKRPVRNNIDRQPRAIGGGNTRSGHFGFWCGVYIWALPGKFLEIPKSSGKDKKQSAPKNPQPDR